MEDRPENECPVCLGASGTLCDTFRTGRDSTGYDCPACGRFEIIRTALVDWFNPQRGRLTAMHRAAMSHKLRSASRSGSAIMIKTDWMEHFITNARLPSPGEQATNLIRLLGDYTLDTGEGYRLDDVADTALVGSLNAQMFGQLRNELEAKGLVQRLGSAQVTNPRDVGVLIASVYGLTLDGWDRYETEKHGRISGRYGFLAMKFGDAILDALVRDVVKPAVKGGTGYDLVDLRDVARAGVIDNILREQIRDAAFVLVDLTHDNFGAYWEAGYAEGLGKPVIYLCEKSKFDQARTHFDTNHCTTVLWTVEDSASLEQLLVATLRRSLNLF